MAALTDSALAHDDLSEPNEPVYFHEFVADLERNRLTFLAEAELHSMVGGGITPRVRLALGSMDRLAREQYLDFVHLRRYRQSIVCREGALSRFVVDPARAKAMHASASIYLLQLRREGNFEVPGEDADLRALKELLVARWPRSVPVTELALWHAGRARSSEQGATPRNPIENLVVQTYGAGLLELHVVPPAVVERAGQCPTAFAPARRQARDSDEVTNVYHAIVRIGDSSQRQLLSLLDGTRTREQLVAEANARFGGPDRAGLLQQSLDQFARLGLLVN